MLRGYADIMSDQLHKTLPPGKDVDHEIELLTGLKLPAKALNRMAPPKLEELRNQLINLLVGGSLDHQKPHMEHLSYYR